MDLEMEDRILQVLQMMVKGVVLVFKLLRKNRILKIKHIVTLKNV